jgi:hypothetical protein
MRVVEVVTLGVLIAGCQIEAIPEPSLAGPSELGLSLRVSAVPDVLPQDGVSAAEVRVLARDAAGRPAGGLSLRAELAVNDRLVDFGRLSSKFALTGADGVARFVYTAPPGPSAGNTDAGTAVTIRVTPVGEDFGAAVPHIARVRIVPLGQLLPPAGTPVAVFTFSPRSPRQGDPVFFDASQSRDCPPEAETPSDCLTAETLRAYVWTFGDGETSIGARVSHRYRARGEFVVSLTVTNDRGRSATTTASVVVSAKEPES